MRSRPLLLAALVLVLLVLPAAALAAVDHGFDAPTNPPTGPDTSQQLQHPGYIGPNVQRNNTPNDPEYDAAEPDDPDNGGKTSIYDEQFDLFGFASRRTPSTVYSDPSDRPRLGKLQIAGFNAAGAWKETRGDPGTTVAILDTGIKWDNAGLRLKVHLNTGELPKPEDAQGRPAASYDANGDGAVNVEDYKDDPRVSITWPDRKGPTGLITAQDLIHAFSDHTDADHNGFVDDIAGWDFFNDDNDPFDQSSYFAASNHGTGRTAEAVEQGNEGASSIGVCPKCQFVPVRVWDTFVSDGDTFGLGIFYGTKIGAKVIEGADGNLYHSKFTERASRYAYEQGVTQTYSGDDLNTANHNYPANYNHTMLIEGTVPDTVGLGQSNEITQTFAKIPVPSNLAPGTFFRGANTTQFGGKSSISMEGPTGSTNTGKASGAAALVISAAKKHGTDLSADETREILEQTAEDVLPGNTGGVGVPDPATTGWDSHFGWGRADVGRAVSVAIDEKKIPAEASIASPDWYAPVTGNSVRITGRARARFAPGGAFHWKLETCPTFQTGQGDGPCTTVREADATGTVTDFGTIDPQGIARDAAIDPAGPYFDPTRTNPFKGQFTVRLVVSEPGNASATPGIDRKVLTALSDPTLRPGYPKRLGTGGEAPIRYADLNGDNVPEFVVPLEDGTLHAYEPDGSELPGWPVRTRTLAQAAPHAGALGAAGVEPPLEPLRGAVVADIDGDGRPEVIDAAGTHIYVWEANGKLRPGFPVSINPDFCRGQDQRQKALPGLPVTHRKCGFLASPALAHLEGRSKPLDIVASALDGHVYAFRADGSSVPHFPFELVDSSMGDKRVLAESINDPAIGDLNGDGKDDIVVASNENYGATDSPDFQGGFAGAIAFALGKAAGGSSRVYAINGATGAALSGWPIKLNGGIQSTLPLVGPGHDAALAKLGGQQRVVVSTTGGAIGVYDPAGRKIRDLTQGPTGPASNVPEKDPQQLNLFESASIGNLDGSGPAVVKYGVTLAQAANLVLAGQNVPYEHVINAIDPIADRQLPAFPQVTDDYQFLSASNIGKVAPGASNQVLAGTALGLLHAYDGVSGQDAPGFPKVTGGWLFAPPALSDDHRIAEITREGYLFEWGAPGAPSCQTEWPSFRHDAQQTGNYDADGTPPAAPGGLTVTPLGGNRYRLAFTSPGDDGLCGTAASYVAEVGGKPVELKLGSPVSGGRRFSREVTLPANFSSFSLRARDEAGNNGAPVALASCRDRARPTLRFGGLRGARRTIDLRGSAADGGCAGSVPARTIARRGAVRSVRLAVSVFVRGGCRFVRADGRLTSTQSCRRPLFVTARGTTRWALRVRGTFPSGRYVVRSRVYDRAGNVGRPDPRLFRIGRVPARFTG